MNCRCVKSADNYLAGSNCRKLKRIAEKIISICIWMAHGCGKHRRVWHIPILRSSPDLIPCICLLYKGLGGLGGAMLVGQSDFIARAKVWMHRQGGSVFRRTPYVVAAAMQFEQRIAMMPALFETTRQLYKLLSGYPDFMLNPSKPQVSMFHVYLPVSRDRALQIRNKIAKEHGIWLFNNAVHAPLQEQSMFEWNVGDHLLHLSDQSLSNALDLFVAELRQTSD